MEEANISKTIGRHRSDRKLEESKEEQDKRKRKVDRNTYPAYPTQEPRVYRFLSHTYYQKSTNNRQLFTMVIMKEVTEVEEAVIWVGNRQT